MPGRLTLTEAGDRLRGVDLRALPDRLREVGRRVVWAVTDGLAATAQRLRGTDPRRAAAAAADRLDPRLAAAATAARLRGISPRTIAWAVAGVLAFAVPLAVNALRGEAATVTRATVLEPPRLAAPPEAPRLQTPLPLPGPPRPAPRPAPVVAAPAPVPTPAATPAPPSVAAPAPAAPAPEPPQTFDSEG